MFEFFIAKKHILEKKKQSIIGIIGIMIGITVLIVSIGISNGLDKNMIDSILSLSSHVSVYDVNNKIEYEKLEKEIRKIPEVKGVLPKISTQGLIKYKGVYGDYISGVKIEGFDIKKAQEAIELDKKIVAGKINPQKKNGIYIGNELYKQLGAKIGNKITVVSAENQELPFEIAGVFESGYYEYDINMVIIPLETAQYMMYMEDRITNLEITLYNPYEAEKISNELFEKFGVFNRTWGSQNKNLLSALALEKTVMIIVFSLIVVIAGFVVWVIMNMLVREKIKDIGIMRAMGFTKKNIMKIFLIEGMLLGVIGIFIGVMLSLGILWYIKNYSIAGITSIYYLSKVPIEISAKEILIIVFINFIVIFLSSIFPAYRAGKMETMEALRYE
ncbi:MULTISPECIES: ABC transporter permease [Fusobacterium]|uniref:ABC transporter permease n=1 Tax=Fusobacterium TaxID=848 RepID=UPI00147767E8|nr:MULTISPECIES: ABC transporter permease [Fusobacterium]NME35628.1 ABC transporter permease [Fusobacterium sp. FSA-380-WT-3A]